MTTPPEFQIASPAETPRGRWQFTLGGLFMFVTLVAILLTFVKAEGCGRAFVRIGSVEFSPDGKRLAVAKYNARDANTPLKLYMTDLLCTISVVNVESQRAEKVIEQTTKPGNQGPAFMLFEYAGNCLAFGPDENTLLVVEYGGGHVNQYDLTSGQKQSVFVFPVKDALALTLSRDRTLLATGHPWGVALWNARSGKRLWKIVTPDMPFIHTPITAVSFDNRVVATAGSSGVWLWNASDGTSRGFLRGLTPEFEVESLVYSPTDDRIAIGLGCEVRVYESGKLRFSKGLTSGQQLIRILAFSPDGQRVAAALGNDVVVLDSFTGKQLATMHRDHYCTSLAYAPDGTMLAVGDDAGQVALWTPTASGPPTMVAIPGGAGHSWPYSVTALALWFLVYLNLRRRRQLRAITASREVPSSR